MHDVCHCDVSACDVDAVAVIVVVVKTVLLLCDSLSAIDDIRNGVLCSLVPDLMSLMSAVTRPFAPRETTTRVTVCCECDDMLHCCM